MKTILVAAAAVIGAIFLLLLAVALVIWLAMKAEEW